MGYTLDSSQKAPVLDGNGGQILTASITGAGGAGDLPPFDKGAAIMQDDGAGNLEVVGVAPGTSTFDIVFDGVAITHDIAVTAAPFDWTLGAPVAK